MEVQVNSGNRDHYEVQNNPDANQAFITSFATSGPNQDQITQKDPHDVHFLELSGQERVAYVYEKLQLQVDSMDTLMDQMLEKQEVDFLAAYRGHMMKVQKEIVGLKKLLTEKEFKITRDKRISNLQRSLTWFRDEALNLSKLYESKKKEHREIIVQSKLMQDSQYFLEEGLKNAKRETLMVKSQLEKQQQHTQQLIDIVRSLQQQRNKDNSQPSREVHKIVHDIESHLLSKDGKHHQKGEDSQFKPSNILQTKDSRSYSNVMRPIVKNGFQSPINSQGIFDKTGLDIEGKEQQQQQYHTMSTESFLLSILEESGNTNFLNETVAQISEYVEQKLLRYQTQIDRLQKQGAAQKQKTKQLQLSLAQVDTHSKLEEIFKECIEQINKDRNRSSSSSLIGGSTLYSARRLKQSLGSKRNNHSTMKSEILQNDIQSQTIGSPRQVQAGNLKPHEKRKIVESFMQNDEIFVKIYDTLYSPDLSRMRSHHNNDAIEVTHQNKRYLSDVLDSLSDPLSKTMNSQINSNSNNTNINIFLTSQNDDLTSSKQYKYADVKNGKLIPRASFIHKQEQQKALIQQDSERQPSEDRSNIKIQQYHLYNPSEQTIKSFSNSQSQQRQSRPFSSYHTTARTVKLNGNMSGSSKNQIQGSFHLNSSGQTQQRPQTNQVNKRTLLNRTLNQDTYSSLNSHNNNIINI